MSKGLSPLKLGYAPQRHLPFVVVSSVPRCGTGLLLASDVKPKVLNSVVALVAVHVIDKLFGRYRAPQMNGHRPSMRQDGLTMALHRSVHRQKVIGNIPYADEMVAVACDATDVFATVGDAPSVLSGRHGSKRTRPAEALKVCAKRLFANLGGGSLSISSRRRTMTRPQPLFCLVCQSRNNPVRE